ncbi:MAG: hypothetical protein MJ200_02315 [Mycoplasmoidaceae bacterium]|nr:hypothetical protein [Mycoplasmoidaceae bacterium]
MLFLINLGRLFIKSIKLKLGAKIVNITKTTQINEVHIHCFQFGLFFKRIRGIKTMNKKYQ